jgi:hypothetical protein
MEGNKFATLAAAMIRKEQGGRAASTRRAV